MQPESEGNNRLPISFTRFTSDTPLSKTFSTNDSCEIVKTAAAQMTHGKSARVNCDFRDFENILNTFTEYDACGYGMYEHDTAVIVTAKNVVPFQSIARTKHYFPYRNTPGILMLDHDPSEFVPRLDPADLLAKLTPIIGNPAMLVRGSVSSGVRQCGDSLKPSKGYHVYIPVLDASDIPRAGEALVQRLWLAGLGVIALSKSGSMLERTIIDGAVFSGERLDFTGKPVLVDDFLEYVPPVGEYHDGDYLDTAVIKSLTSEELNEYNSLVDIAKQAMGGAAQSAKLEFVDTKLQTMVAAGVDEDAARKQLNAFVAGSGQDLPPDFVLHFATRGVATVASVLADPLMYDNEALADPIEGPSYGLTTAKFYANIGQGNEKPVIHSMAHGVKLVYFLKATIPLSVAVTADAADDDYPDAGKADNAWIDKLISNPIQTNDQSEIARLALLSRIDYDQTRINAAKNLGIRTTTLDSLVAAEVQAQQAKDYDTLQKQLRRDEHGKVVQHHLNACLCVEYLTNENMGYNEFRQRIELIEPPKWRSTAGMWDITDSGELTNIINDKYAAFTLGAIHDAVGIVSFRHKFNPAQDRLRGLAFDWDGTPRIDMWLFEYLNAHECHANFTYLTELSSNWLKGVAARVLNPGCKRDDVIVFYSPQGYGKSTAAQIIADVIHPDAFTDGIGDMGSKDSRAALRGIIIAELGELAALNKSEVETIKAFVTTRVDHFREAYGRSERDYPRTVSFIGTTNNPDYLKDSTGNRRWWPVTITDPIDLDKLRAIMPQLMGEAAARVIKGETWHVTNPIAIKEANEVREEAYQSDVWTDEVLATAQSLMSSAHADYVTIASILTAMNIPTAQQDRAKENRVGSVLRMAQYTSKQKRVGSSTIRIWYPPASQNIAAS